MLSLISFQILAPRYSIVCCCFGQSISHSRGEPCVVIMGFFNRSEKTLKLVGRSWFLNLYIKTAM